MIPSLEDLYLNLVVRIVRGMSPVPEHREVSTCRMDDARTHLDRLRDNPMFSTVIEAGPEALDQIWSRVSPPALTMCGEKSIANLLTCLDTVLRENIPGDFIETGVWRGGLPILMRTFLRTRGVTDRIVWVADSFCGLPETPKDPRDRVADAVLAPVLRLSVSRTQVEESFAFFGLLDNQVRFLEGWFSETLPEAPLGALAILRLDGDYFESTWTAIESLYPRLSVGGFIIIDDYHLPLGCRDAVDRYRERYGITEPLQAINSQAVFWRKSREVSQESKT